jgi:small subunit ribosomal protein S27e
MTKSKFLVIDCPRCHTPHTVYSRATLRIKCNECNKLLIKPTGGKTRLKARLKRVLLINKSK